MASACPTTGCPLCSRKGFVVIVGVFILLLLLPQQYSWIGLSAFILAYVYLLRSG